MKLHDVYEDATGYIYTITKNVKGMLTMIKEGNFPTIGLPDKQLTQYGKRTLQMTEKELQRLISFRRFTLKQGYESPNNESENDKTEKAPPAEDKNLIPPSVRADNDGGRTVTRNVKPPDNGLVQNSLF